MLLLFVVERRSKWKKKKELKEREWQWKIGSMWYKGWNASQKPHARSALLTLNPDLYADLLIPSRVPFSFSHWAIFPTLPFVLVQSCLLLYYGEHVASRHSRYIKFYPSIYWNPHVDTNSNNSLWLSPKLIFNSAGWSTYLCITLSYQRPTLYNNTNNPLLLLLLSNHPIWQILLGVRIITCAFHSQNGVTCDVRACFELVYH